MNCKINAKSPLQGSFCMKTVGHRLDQPVAVRCSGNSGCFNNGPWLLHFWLACL